MDKYRVVSHKEMKFGQEKRYSIIAIEDIIPKFVKINSKIDIKVNSNIYIDNEYAYYKKKGIGEVVTSKSGEGVLIDNSYNIKYTGGYSFMGDRIFVDASFPVLILINGRILNSLESIGRHHELVEKWLIDEGYTYAHAHKVATDVERRYVSSLNIKWSEYCAEVEKHMHKVYTGQLQKSPEDLDLTPYIYSRDFGALNEIKNTTPNDIISLND